MRRDDILEALRRRPFQPIRLYVSDGATYEIRHPEMVLIARHSAVVGHPDTDSPPPAVEKLTYVDLLHITRMETIGSSGASPSNGQ
jgi:hypothetical protein